AVKTAIVWSEHLEQAWANIRLQHLGLVQSLPAVHQADGSVGPKISDALETYLELKGSGKGELFFTANRRALSYLIDTLGDLRVDQYTSTEAAQFRDALFAKDLSSSSVKRLFSVIRAIFQLTLTEQGIQTPNPFKGTYLPSRNDVRKRPPIQIEDIHHIQAECRQSNDDLR
ncbi:integrase, partial [Alphaproteobacteria bacterium]|nr:integrase [Alphaproteobacteria bacterium]